jgi:hypothetical protein
MIKVEGYKAFSGIMRITERRLGKDPYEIEGHWLYDPKKDQWYVNDEKEDYSSVFSPYYYNLEIIKDYTE